MAKVIKKSKKSSGEEIVKKKKKKAKAVEEAPVKKKKKKVVEEKSTKKKGKKVEEKSPKKKAKKAKVVKELPTYDAVKEKFRITGLIEELAERADVDKKEAKRVFEAMQDIMLGSLVKKGVGEFMWPGLFKMVTIKKPAVKGGKKVKNPFKPGEMMITKDKPATVKVKVRPMKKLKDAALV